MIAGLHYAATITALFDAGENELNEQDKAAEQVRGGIESAPTIKLANAVEALHIAVDGLECAIAKLPEPKTDFVPSERLALAEVRKAIAALSAPVTPAAEQQPIELVPSTTPHLWMDAQGNYYKGLDVKAITGFWPATPPAQDARELPKELEALADRAYCQYIEQMRRELCLGYEFKLNHGKFSKDNLDAFMKAAEFLGRHRAMSDAAVLARSALSQQDSGDALHAGYGETDFGFTFAGIRLTEGDKRLATLIVKALGTDHPAMDDLTSLLFRARQQSDSKE